MSTESEETVLIVDDEPNVVEAYSLYLSEGYTVRTATDGEEALEQLDDAVDVVLLDRLMPGLSGDEVLETIVQRGYTCRVAMVTAVDPDFDIIEMDFDAYLTKPVTKAEVRGTVDRLLATTSFEELAYEYFVLSQKRATLEEQKPEGELIKNDRYTELVARINELETQVEEMAGELTDDEFTVLFKQLPP